MLNKKIPVFIIVVFVLGLFIYIPGKKWARGHVNYKTAVDDHPLLCTNCHLHITKNKVIRNLVNSDYYSPVSYTHLTLPTIYSV